MATYNFEKFNTMADFYRFCESGFVTLLNSNPSSKLENSKWLIQYGYLNFLKIENVSGFP